MTNKQQQIPAIRFNGFADDWEQRKLGEYIEDYIEKTVTLNQYPVLTSSQQQGIVLQEEYFADRQVTTQDNIGYFVLPRGYFTYRSRSDNGIFKFNRNDIIDKGIISYFYPVFKIINGDSDFFLYLLNSTTKKQVMLEAEGTGQKVLSLKKFKNITISVTSINEQLQIGAFLKQLERTIALHQRQMNDYKQLKKSMLQKMFPQDGEKVPKIRFDGFTKEWEQRKLGDCFAERNERMSEGELISVTINSGVVKASSLDRKDNSSEDKSNYKKVEIGDIAYNSMRMWQGASGVSRYSGILSPAYTVIVPKKQISSVFFSYLFKLNKMIQTFQANSQGLTSDTWNLKYPVLKDIKVYVPNYEEQNKIGNFFKQLDDTIAFHQQKVNDYQQVKKALLQQMFV